MKLKNIYLHFKKICIHKYWVGYYCFKAGIPIQGILHDLSKFSPTEFWESVKYYQGTYSPIDACKKKKGYSNAWFHHRGRNKHHWEYWCDNFEKGTQPVEMPYRYAVEMFCDFMGAGRAYNGKSFSYKKELDWWNEKKKVAVIAPKTMGFIDRAMRECARLNQNEFLNKKDFEFFYAMRLTNK